MPVTLEDHIPEISRSLGAIMDGILEDGAERVRDLAKAKVPVDSGDLKETIHVEQVGPYEWAVIAGGKSITGESIWYGHLIEFGHNLVVGRRKADQRIVGHIAPQPFLIPALELERRTMATVGQTKLKEALE